MTSPNTTQEERVNGLTREDWEVSDGIRRLYDEWERWNGLKPLNGGSTALTPRRVPQREMQALWELRAAITWRMNALRDREGATIPKGRPGRIL
jgi:hypothetical protein